MEEFLHRPKQELDKVGPVFSPKNERQRAAAEDIRNLRVPTPAKETMINLNIPGLEKKKFPGRKNPATLRLYAPLTNFGRTGMAFVTHHNNISRFGIPFFICLFYYYQAENYIRGTYYDKELNNCETESVYFKLQTFNIHFPEKNTLMTM
eukprot:CAMPEP_0170518190 /NCGR_PEP_ID=MMETSP0209-20121228/3937_1 /TAXON_ID=665100 ORGANISM="Litonotus pictus, Strain P1" /NCGR_SAMPLE_ID=MMETSP0209 /ASSEMBLY_ACC=CAM_ASM_000301 /LENGTH=149 /DNA_ID=CAMNT_0010803655 /DNA_START=38 /DNA_END=487 /DNA_ORIENTATION=+